MTRYEMGATKRYRQFHAEMQAHILNCLNERGEIWQPAKALLDVTALETRGYIMRTGKTSYLKFGDVPNIPVYQYKLASEMWAQS